MKPIIGIISFIIFTQTLFGQTPLDVKIDFNADNIPLEIALLELIENEAVRLSFSNNLIPQEIKVSFNASNERLEDVLKRMLGSTELSWQIIGEQIVIIKLPFNKRPKYTLNGYLEDSQSGERIIGATVFSTDTSILAITNEFGFYSLTLPAGTRKIGFSYLGFERVYKGISLYKDESLDVELKPIFLTQILVKPIEDSLFLTNSNISQDHINIDNIKQFPGLGGEPDVVRLIHHLPGVQTGADGFGNLSVRGGNADQNLFLLDGVPVYNASHALGIFSIYNSSAILSADFYKGVFPAKFGGRISSVLDVRTKEGNKKRHLLETDIGLTSIKFTMEGPLGKKKNASFFASGRRALFDFYSIPYTQKIRARKGIDGYLGYYFYDLNLKLNQRISKKDQIYLSIYNGRDDFKDIQDEAKTFGDTTLFLMDNDTIIWGNTLASFRWNRIHAGKLFSNTTLTYSKFFYESEQFVDYQEIIGQQQQSRAILFLQYRSYNEDIAAKIDFQYYPNEKHEIDFGLNATKHKFQPGIVNINETALLEEIDLDTIGEFDKTFLESIEIDAYFQDEIKFNKDFVANLGVRFTGLRSDESWQTSWQPRFLFKFFPENPLSFKLAIGKHTQNLHLLSSSTFGLPKDLWVSATALRKPQQAWQIVGGLEYKWKSGIELSIESYYKKMKNLLIFNQALLERITATNWQYKVSVGEGESYGLEYLLKKQTGKTTGWLGYTLSWSNRQFESDVNSGESFPIKLDRRHNLTFQLLHKINSKWNFSAGWVYSTGVAYTQPIGEYVIHLPGLGDDPVIQLVNVSLVSKINNQRLPPYHRLDLGVNYHFSKRKLKHSIKLGVYNAYLRKNPAFRTTREVIQDNGEVDSEFIQVSLLPVFPSLRYSVVFL